MQTDIERKILLEKILVNAGIDAGKEEIEKLYIYYEMLIEKNKVMNLTAITDFEEVAVKHFVDSLAIRKITNLDEYKNEGEKKLRVIDIGTGAGFPGIPLKIIYPSLEITLLDSLRKRVDFLDEVIERLKLKNIRAVHGRAEELARKDEYREQYDLAVSRAVANLSTLSEFCLPFVKVKGSFVSYKGSKAEQEITEAKSAIHMLGGKITGDKSFFLSEETNERRLIKIEKISATDKKYPRGGGKPVKAPLGNKLTKEQ